MKKNKITQKNRRDLLSRHSPAACFYRIQRHFFPGLPSWLNQMKDPRHPAYITYSQSVLITMILMKCNTGIESMRQMTSVFNTEAAIENLRVIAGEADLEEKPDWQTINNYLERLPAERLEHIRYQMIRALIRTKQFYPFTVEGRYCIIIDGTDIAYFRGKHCKHDLVKIVIDQKTGEQRLQYYHKALEAKIVLGPGLILSIATEFIENEDEKVSKQDCELNAGFRLIRKLKKAFPRMDVLIIGDALFCTMPFMNAVRAAGWNYLFRVKSGRQGQLMEDFEYLLENTEDRITISGLYPGENGTGMFVNHVEEISNKPETCKMFHYLCRKENTMEFDWVTDIELSAEKLTCMIQAGRSRWKIENEGFNTQKNGIYHLEHHCSLDWNAMKNHYLLIQIAHILMQLYLAFDQIIYQLNEGMKKAAEHLLSSLANQGMCKEDLEYAQRSTSLHMCCRQIGLN